MLISINPTITGGFVYHTLKDPVVSKFISDLKLSKEDAHNFVKAVLIVGSRDLEIDFEKILKDIQKIYNLTDSNWVMSKRKDIK